MGRTFFFHFDVKPRPDHPEYQHPGAVADIWVVDEDEAKAEARARHYLDEHLLDITAEGIRGETDPTQYDGRELGRAMYEKAQRFGIALSLGFWERE